MQKIDRLGWAAGICIEAFGVRIGIRTNDARALRRVAAALPPGWRPARSPYVDQLYSLRLGDTGAGRVRRFHLLYFGLQRRARSLDAELVFETLASDLRQHLAAASPSHVFLHAGVVGWRGRALVLPGASFAGKTTLVEALVRRGATYYSDEFAVVDRRGCVHPFPKPLSVRDAEGRPRSRPAAALGARVGVRPLRVGLVALLRYRQAARLRPTRLTPGQALLALLAHAAPIRKRPDATLRALARAMDGVAVLRGLRADAGAAADALLTMLDEPAGRRRRPLAA